jgi:uncharacterized SAM-binding protein YcdF (DUF218 family)
VIVSTVVAIRLGLYLVRRFWLALIGRFLVVRDPLVLADAVIPLAGGGAERVVHAAMLFDRGYAGWLVVTETLLSVPGIRATRGELVRQEAVWGGVPEDRVLIAPGTVRTTYEEALAVRRLARERGWHSLIVVTDPYHTRRTRMSFREVFRGTGIAVIVRPVDGHWYHADSWWHSPDGLRATWNEYAKLLLHMTGYH